MDLIDKRDEVLRTFLEYGIKDCEWCGLRKTDLAECAEAIVKKLTIPDVVGRSEQLFCSKCGTAFEYDWYVEYDNCSKCGCDVAK